MTSSKMAEPAQQLRVGVLGATGAVGQRFVQLLEHHPWFTVTVVGARYAADRGQRSLSRVEATAERHATPLATSGSDPATARWASATWTPFGGGCCPRICPRRWLTWSSCPANQSTFRSVTWSSPGWTARLPAMSVHNWEKRRQAKRGRSSPAALCLLLACQYHKRRHLWPTISRCLAMPRTTA